MIAIVASPWILFIFGMASGYFGVQTLRLLPPLFRLLAALRSGMVKWPGPIAEYPLSKRRITRLRIIIHVEHLFSTFIGFALGVVGAFAYSMVWFINGFLLLVAPQEGKALTVAMLSGLVFLGARLSID